jgi:glutamine amidotransferase PdxT
MILMAKEILDGVPGQPVLELMDIAVRRNAKFWPPGGQF